MSKGAWIGSSAFSFFKGYLDLLTWIFLWNLGFQRGYRYATSFGRSWCFWRWFWKQRFENDFGIHFKSCCSKGSRFSRRNIFIAFHDGHKWEGLDCVIWQCGCYSESDRTLVCSLIKNKDLGEESLVFPFVQSRVSLGNVSN